MTRHPDYLRRFAPLLIVGFASLLNVAHFAAEDDCEVDDCITVVAPRITCADGWTCSDGQPRVTSVDCWQDLTAIPNAGISGFFGEPRGPRGPDGRRRQHNGIDIPVPTGTDIYAAKDGEVVDAFDGFEAGEGTNNGNYVRINYDDGTQGVYLHLLSVSVATGDGVSAGDQVGVSNDTGHSQGPHLHYTQYDSQEEAVDPTLEHGACG